jgi:hypothetical protein
MRTSTRVTAMRSHPEKSRVGAGIIRVVCARVALLLALHMFGPWSVQMAHAQFQNIYQSSNFRLGEAFYRVAEPTQLADTVLVWGDVTMPGTYLVPKGTSVARMLSYAKGPSRYVNNETVLDWSQLRVQVSVSTPSEAMQQGAIEVYTLHFDQPPPHGFMDRPIRNGDVLAVEVKRKPSFADWVRVIGPAVSTLATTILIVQNLSR